MKLNQLLFTALIATTLIAPTSSWANDEDKPITVKEKQEIRQKATEAYQKDALPGLNWLKTKVKHVSKLKQTFLHLANQFDPNGDQAEIVDAQNYILAYKGKVLPANETFQKYKTVITEAINGNWNYQKLHEFALAQLKEFDVTETHPATKHAMDEVIKPALDAQMLLAILDQLTLTQKDAKDFKQRFYSSVAKAKKGFEALPRELFENYWAILTLDQALNR